MPTELLSSGPAHTLTEDRIYAVPGFQCLMTVNDPVLTYQSSVEVSFASPTTLTLDDNDQCYVGGGFIRCTDGNPIVTLSRTYTVPNN